MLYHAVTFAMTLALLQFIWLHPPSTSKTRLRNKDVACTAREFEYDYTKHDYIFSNEGCTQGDVTAMAIYALGIRPLIDNLREAVDHAKCKQSWYADDSSAGGQLTEMKTWWDQLRTMGPKYGYYPQASKTILIVKERFEAKAKAIFGKSGIKISTRDEQHMGAVVGSERFKDEYVSNKVEKWVQDIEQLSNIAKD